MTKTANQIPTRTRRINWVEKHLAAQRKREEKKLEAAFLLLLANL
jgi:hypothetical protein